MARGLVSFLVFTSALVQGFISPCSKTNKLRKFDNAMSKNLENEMNLKSKFASVTVAAFIFAGSLTAPLEQSVAFSQPSVGDSTTLLAARSGGRTGGRSSSARPSSSYRPSTSRSTTVYSPTIVRPIYTPPPVVIGSPFGYSPFGFGYNPLGVGLGAVNTITNEIRDSNQEREIRDEKAELEATKARAAELERRLDALERSSTK